MTWSILGGGVELWGGVGSNPVWYMFLWVKYTWEWLDYTYCCIQIVAVYCSKQWWRGIWLLPSPWCWTGIEVNFGFYTLWPQTPPLYYTATSPDQSRLWQLLKPHTAEPIRRRGSDGPPPAGRAHSKHIHVTVEGRGSACLAGGCHGNAHVHPCLLWKRQEWQGTSSAQQ